MLSSANTYNHRLLASSQGSVLFTDSTRNTPRSLSDYADEYTTDDIAPAPAQYTSSATVTPLTTESLAEHEQNILLADTEEKQSEQTDLDQLKHVLESLGVNLPDSIVLRMLSKVESPTAYECSFVKGGTTMTGGDGSESMADTPVL